MKSFTMLTLLLLSTAAQQPPRLPSDVVERQVAAYNFHDADAFAVTYAEDAAIYRAPATEPILRGRAAIRARYAALFAANPDAHVEISGRLIAGNFISDHETIIGTNIRAVVVYEVRRGFIQNAWLFASATP